MKFRLTEQISQVEGGNVFMVYYKRDTPAGTSVESPWVYFANFNTEGEARDFICGQMEKPRERFIEEFEVKQ